MRGREVIKRIMEAKGVTNADIAKRLNLTNAAVWERLNNKNVKDIPVSLLSEMLRVLDYKILVVPASARIPEKGYVVDGLSEKEE